MSCWIKSVGENGFVTRPVATWEEAHKLVVEYEKLNKEDRVIAVGMMPLDGGVPVPPKGTKVPAGWGATTLMDGDGNPVIAFVPGGKGAKAQGGRRRQERVLRKARHGQLYEDELTLRS